MSGRAERNALIKSVHDRMEHARQHARGTLELRVCFFRQDALDIALKWMTGKRNVKTIQPVLYEGPPPRGVSVPEWKK